MNIGVYQSAASLSALERWQDAVTQNISASQVSGFKRRTVQIDGQQSGELLYGANMRPDQGDGRAAIFPAVRYGVAFSAGEIQPTRRDLDFAIMGDGFFNVRMPDGATGYTRSGQLQIRPDRTLITSQGLEILNEIGQPLQLAPEGGPLTVDAQGNLTQGDVQLGQLAVTRFDNPEQLLPMANGLFVAAPGAGGQPAEKAGVLQGHIESSNIQPLQEMVHLVNIARAYEANQKIIQTRDQMLQRTLDAVS